MRPETLVALAGAITLATARQASDFLLPQEEYASYACGEECQKAINASVPMDRLLVGRDFDFDFYATASNFSTALAPGTILKFETVNANKRLVGAGTSLFRMQYTSRDLDGSIVPATAFVALPQAGPRQPDGKKLPLVAWAHGTIGLFAGCAPSNGPGLFDYSTWRPIAQRGYAVVATDYAGLGNNYTSHKYISHLAHANDIYYSVRAVRRALGDRLTGEWMAAGHSQGGGAVWKLAESRFVRNDTRYLGTVAIAPATYVVDMFVDNVGRDIPQLLGYLTFLPFAMERAVPSFKADFVGAPMRKRLDLARRMQVCSGGMLSMVKGLNASQVLDRAGLERSRAELVRWQNSNTAALGDVSPAPVLVIQGSADTTVLVDTTRQAWKRSCAAGNEVHLSVYEGQEHSPSVEAAVPEWVGWIDERFYGNRTLGERKCLEKLRPLLAGNNTSTPPEV